MRTIVHQLLLILLRLIFETSSIYKLLIYLLLIQHGRLVILVQHLVAFIRANLLHMRFVDHHLLRNLYFFLSGLGLTIHFFYIAILKIVCNCFVFLLAQLVRIKLGSALHIFQDLYFSIHVLAGVGSIKGGINLIGSARSIIWPRLGIIFILVWLGLLYLSLVPLWILDLLSI